MLVIRRIVQLFWAVPFVVVGAILTATIIGAPVGLVLIKIGAAPLQRSGDKKFRKEWKAYTDAVDNMKMDEGIELTEEMIADAVAAVEPVKRNTMAKTEYASFDDIKDTYREELPPVPWIIEDEGNGNA